MWRSVERKKEEGIEKPMRLSRMMMTTTKKKKGWGRRKGRKNRKEKKGLRRGNRD